MSNLKLSQQASDMKTQICKKRDDTVKKSIALAFERTNLPVFNLDNLTTDVLREFEGKDIYIITKAIKNGSLGLYGRTYRMSTQEVCIWIREFLKSYKPPMQKNPYKL